MIRLARTTCRGEDDGLITNSKNKCNQYMTINRRQLCRQSMCAVPVIYRIGSLIVRGAVEENPAPRTVDPIPGMRALMMMCVMILFYRITVTIIKITPKDECLTPGLGASHPFERPTSALGPGKRPETSRASMEANRGPSDSMWICDKRAWRLCSCLS